MPVKTSGDDDRGPTAPDVETPDHVLALLGSLLDGLRRDVQAAQSSRPGLGDDLRSLRSSQLRLLSLTPAGGMRVTDLAERLGMTKQALGEFATALEERGLLESVRDPSDRRVRILRPTPRGLQTAAESTEVIATVEAQWRLRVGAERWDQLRDLLRTASARTGQTPPQTRG